MTRVHQQHEAVNAIKTTEYELILDMAWQNKRKTIQYILSERELTREYCRKEGNRYKAESHDQI